MRLAAASSANTPLAVKIGRAAMQILEVVPGVTVEEVMSGPLKSVLLSTPSKCSGLWIMYRLKRDADSR